MKNILTVVAAMVVAFMVVAIFIFLFAWPAMWLWNMLIPNIFNGPTLTFWQTFGLLILARIFFPQSTKVNTPSNSK